MESMEPRLPRARAAGLSSKTLRGELVIYDHERHRCHALNRTASLVWGSCDGETTLAQITSRLTELGLPAEEGLVWLALDRLSKAHLLEGVPGGSTERTRYTRRAALRKV